jgi:membrane-associated phospholipid phosphatase
MWTGECAAAWRLFLFNWIVIGFIGTAFALSLLLTTFSLGWYPFLVGCGFVAVYAAFALYNAIARNRRDPQVVFVLGGTAQIVLITLLMAPFTYVAAAANFPMQDGALLAIDQAIGFDGLAYVKFVNDRPLLAAWMDAGYSMIKWPLFAIPVVLAAGQQYRRLQEYTLAFALALMVTTVISTLVPALGVFQQLGLAITDFANINPLAYVPPLRDLPAVRDGTLRELHIEALTGIITFPSFHAASAILYGWALWRSRWFRPIALVANAMMLAATPVVGGHYLIDVVAGIVVAALAIAAACGISRHRDARVALSQTAQPPEHAAAVSPEGATAPSAS